MTRTGKDKMSSPMVPQSVATRDSDYGSFEVVDDQPRASGRGPGSGRGKNWSVVVLAVLLLGLGGTGFAMLMIDGEDEEADDDGVASEAPAFQPYGGGGVAETSDRGAPAEVVVDDDGASDEESSNRERSGEADRRERPLSRRDIDGVEVVEDARGQAITQQEAEDRVRRHAESLESLDKDHHRRLRQRDLERSSRVFERRGGQLGVAPDIQVSEDLQRRIQLQYGEREDEPGGVSADDYRGPGADYDDEYYDDDYYDDDDYYYDDY